MLTIRLGRLALMSWVLITAVLLGVTHAFAGSTNFDAIFAVGQNCTLSKPPIESGANSNHGQYFFVFPRRVPEDYTGCQTMWSEDGAKIMVLYFENGRLRASLDKTPGEKDLRCDYRNIEATKAEGDCRLGVDRPVIESYPLSDKPAAREKLEALLAR